MKLYSVKINGTTVFNGLTKQSQLEFMAKFGKKSTIPLEPLCREINRKEG